MIGKLKDWFLPTANNGWRAKLLHPEALTGLVIIILLGQLVFRLFPLTHPGVLGYSSDITPEKIVALTNRVRQQMGLPTLRVNKLLNEAARRKAADMFAFNYWAHVSPSGRTPWSFFQEVGYRYTVAGENLAKDFTDADSVVQAWMASPTHRDNILDARFRDIGVAVVRGELNGVKTTLIVQLFGAPIGAENEKVAAAVPPMPKIPQAVAGAKINPFRVAKAGAIFLIGIFLGVLAADSWFAHRYHLYRMTGRNAAHAGLLLALLLLVLLAPQGLIY